METKPVRVVGQIFYAADMVRFNDYTEEKKKYVAQIGKLSEEDAQKIRDLGVNVSENELKGLNISCKSNFVHKPVDEEGNEIDPLTIGNGSKCVAIIGTYDWKFGKKTGKAASLKKLIVTDLIKYEAKAAQEESAEEADDIPF